MKTDSNDFFLENVLEIKSINGISKNAYIDSINKINSSSHRGTLIREVIFSLMCSPNDSIIIECKNGEKYVYYPEKWKNTSHFMNNDSILYINFRKCCNSTNHVRKNLQKGTIKYVFIDLRNGAGKWLFWWNLIKFFGRNEKFSFWQDGFFYCLNGYSYKKTGYQKNGYDGSKFYKGHVYVLIDELVQSHMETRCMILKTNPNTIFIGKNTAGANGNMAKIQLPFKLISNFSYLKFSYPNGENYQGIGIQPDIKENISNITTINQLENIIRKCNLQKYNEPQNHDK